MEETLGINNETSIFKSLYPTRESSYENVKQYVLKKSIERSDPGTKVEVFEKVGIIDTIIKLRKLRITLLSIPTKG